MSVVALVTDLMFSTKISSTGAAVNVPVRVVRTADDLEPGATLLLVDLDAEGAFDAIERCRTMIPAPRIVAFGPHVRADLLAAAREAGADEVLPRSAFVARLPDLLRTGPPGDTLRERPGT